MKNADQAGMYGMVHEWKPVPPDAFVKLLHLYITSCCDQHGHDGLRPDAVKLDRETTATVYYMPKSRKAPDAVWSPVLMTIRMSDGKIICFESLKHGIPPEQRG